MGTYFLKIKPVDIGYIVKNSDGDVTLIADADPVDRTSALLWEVLEQVGHVGSRYDERRVRIVIEPGDKYADLQSLRPEGAPDEQDADADPCE